MKNQTSSGQLAKLCQQEGGKQAGTSMLERSLAHHACTEPCTFRIVTTRDVMDELKGLTLMLESVERGSKRQSLVHSRRRVHSGLTFFGPHLERTVAIGLKGQPGRSCTLSMPWKREIELPWRSRWNVWESSCLLIK